MYGQQSSVRHVGTVLQQAGQASEGLPDVCKHNEIDQPEEDEDNGQSQEAAQG